MKQLQPDDSIAEVPLIGPRAQKLLLKLNIRTVADLLLHAPSRYDDFRQPFTHSVPYGPECVTFRGEISDVHTIRTPQRRMFLTTVTLSSGGTSLTAVWFNQPFLTTTMHFGRELQVSGRLEIDHGKHVMKSPVFELIRPGVMPIHTGRLVPVYPETRGVSSKWLRSRIAHTLSAIELSDWRDHPHPLPKALCNLHFPDDEHDAVRARARLAEDELIITHAKSFARREQWRAHGRAPIILPMNPSIMRKIASQLPFTLTKDQACALADIVGDLNSPHPMNRLLQGDVGSGKTVVAAIAMLLVLQAGHSALLMAPTDILAQQHQKTIRRLLFPFNVPVLLHTASRKESTKAGKTPAIIIGTHALIAQRATFQNVGLVVIDEQHRFGVVQRATLRQKGSSPHILTMTATPIPRTIALTIYGDLTLSSIDTLPSGRIPVKTYLVPDEKRARAVEFIKKQIRSRRQVFIICPFIEPSESIEGIRAATVEYDRLRNSVFQRNQLALLHGRMSSAEKDQILRAFHARKFDILVSTPVVEVGIDVPNATIMLIEGAERFGLAQLHQLRGRVGRSHHQSYCLLFMNRGGKRAFARLKQFENIATGRELAELDLKLRGAGELYGTAQHGIPNFTYADLTNLAMVEKTRRAAFVMWEKNRACFNHPWVQHHFFPQTDPN